MHKGEIKGPVINGCSCKHGAGTMEQIIAPGAFCECHLMLVENNLHLQQFDEWGKSKKIKRSIPV